jgi:lipopolysaccharide biosynthesis regulator YciM
VVIAVAQVDQALPWLDRMLIVQPSSVYALYMHGRVLYSARVYESAGSDFLALAQESHDANMQSAAYTYVALCYGGLQNYTAERNYLHLAVELDHDYNNTTARESASGLH